MAVVQSDLSPLKIPKYVNCTDWLLERSRDCPQRIALVNSDTNEAFSYGEIRNLVTYMCHHLREEHRFLKGEVICFYAPNTPETAIVMLAMFKMGIIVTGVNPVYTPEELRRQADDSGATYMYTVPELLPKVDLTGRQFKKVLVRGSAPGCISLTAILQSGRSIHREYELEGDIDGCGTTAFLPYSSGTTGLPKGVELSHYNIIANVMQITHPEGSILRQEGAMVVGILPFFHVSGVIVSLLNILATKGTLVIMSVFEYTRFLQLVEQYKATSLVLVPPVLLRITKDPNLGNYDLSSVSSVCVGAASTPPDVMKSATQKLNISDVTQGFGMSETTCVASIFASDVGSKLASVGKVMANTEAKIVDVETGATLGLMETGELCIRGPQIMRGYWKKPKQTRDTLDSDGWLHTGDIAYIDGDECIFIVDRLKELIKFKGFQVPPAELEAVLLTNAEIIDVAVVGVPHPEAGEVPKAFVVRRPGAVITTTQIQKYVADRVAPYKRLRGGAELVREIPKSASGKILRRQLKAKAMKMKSNL